MVLLLCACRHSQADSSEPEEITSEMAYEGVNNYCHSTYDWSFASENPSLMYLEMGEENDSAYEVVFRSYTGATVHFYVEKRGGHTRIVEKAPMPGLETEAGSIELLDYLDEGK